MWLVWLRSMIMLYALWLNIAYLKRVNRVQVREIKGAIAMAENDVPVSITRLAMDLDVEDDGMMNVILEQNYVALFKNAIDAPTFTGTVFDANGKSMGPCAITFSDQTKSRFNGVLSLADSLPKEISETDIEDIPHKQGIHCGAHYHEHAGINLMFGRSEPLIDLIMKSQNPPTDTLEPELCFATKHYIYIGVAADCEFVKRTGGHEKARQYIIKTYNEVSMMFQKDFNLAVGIIELVIPTDEQCNDPKWLTEDAPSWNGPCLPASSLSRRLSDFTKWRAVERKNDEAGLWHLVSGYRLEGSEVGLGWIDTLGVRSIKGRHQRSIGGTAVSTLEGPSLTQVIAHELGHNLGASHDCSKQCACEGIACRECCPCTTFESLCDCRGQFLMNPTTNMASLDFSACTIRQICSSLKLRPNHVHPESAALSRIAPYNPTTLCGNGVKEDGEECDCGSPEECALDPCCQEGCKLRPSAECSDRHGGGCCVGCAVVRQKVLCRHARSFCDYEERCDGMVGECPADRFKPDGTTCATGHCASGLCTTRDEQCRIGAVRFHALDYCPSISLRSACQLHCRLPGGECLQLASMLIDGTRCGERGLCKQGVCIEGGVINNRSLRSLVMLCVPIAAVLLISMLFYRRFCK